MSKNTHLERARKIAAIVLISGSGSLYGCVSKHAEKSDVCGTSSSDSCIITASIQKPDTTVSQDVISADPTSARTDKTNQLRPSGKLSEVALYAIEHNPNVDISRWQVKNASASVDLSKVKYRPQFNYSLARGPEYTNFVESEINERHIRTEATIKASQMLYDFGKTKSEVKWAESIEQSYVSRMNHKIETTLFEVADIYLTVMEQDQLIANSTRNEIAHKETHKLVKLNEQGGNATEADVQQAFSRLENVRTQKIELLSQRQRSASEFRRVTGMKPFKLSVPVIRKPFRRSLSASRMESYISRHPFLRSIEIDTESLRHQKDALKRAYFPTLSLEGSASIKENVAGRVPEQEDARVQLVLRGPLYDGGDKLAKISQLEARIGENQARYRKAVYDLERDVQDTIRILRTAQKKRKSVQQRIAASRDVVKLYSQQFKAGHRGIFELLDAQQELFSAQAEEITNRFDVLKAHYSSQLYTGALTSNLLGAGFQLAAK